MTEPRDDFCDHRITPRASRAWRVAKPGTGNYAFTVIWSAGTIAISGDLGELQICHYSELQDPELAAVWIAGSHFDYLISKAPLALAQKEYNAEATAEYLAEWANESIKNGEGLSDWAALGDLTSFSTDHDSPEGRAEIKRELADLSRDEIFGDGFYVDDFYGVDDYTSLHRIRIEALQFWSRKFLESIGQEVPKRT